MKERLAWVDWAKTFSMFAVVVGHGAVWKLDYLVYAFHVPAFFMLSGFLYKPHRVFNTLLSFLIPILFFSSLCWGFNIFEYGFSEGWDRNPLFVFVLNEDRPLFTGLWFLEALFIIRCLMGDCGFSFLLRHYKMLGIASAVAAVVIDMLHFEINVYALRAIECLPFFCFGIFLKELTFDPKTISWRLFFVGAAAFLALVYLNKQCDIMYNRYNATYFPFMVNAIIGSLLLFAVCSRLKPTDFSVQCSIGTLAILGTHNMVGQLLYQFLGNTVPVHILYYFVSMLVAYGIIKLLNRYAPYILGKVKWLR